MLKRLVTANDKVRQRYDIIIHDSFGTYGPVDVLNTLPFFMSLLKPLEGGRTGLAENGLVVANVWCINMSYTESVAASYAQAFNYVRVFGTTGSEDAGGNCFIIAHTPKSDKVTVTCSDGRCKKSKTSKKSKKRKSPICNNIEDAVNIAKRIQEETGMELDISSLISAVHNNRPAFANDDRFC